MKPFALILGCKRWIFARWRRSVFYYCVFLVVLLYVGLSVSFYSSARGIVPPGGNLDGQVRTFRPNTQSLMFPDENFNPRLYAPVGSFFVAEDIKDNRTVISLFKNSGADGVKFNGTTGHNSSKSAYKKFNIVSTNVSQIYFNGKMLNPKESSSQEKPLCPFMSPHLKGRAKPRIPWWPYSYDALEERYQHLQVGGHYSPRGCKARHRTAVIVPYRDRMYNLKLFFDHLHTFLPRQQIEYRIFVVELQPKLRFNRGMILNAGFIEANRHGQFDCIIFHDVDLLPEDDNNLYMCSTYSPKHLAIALNSEEYRRRDHKILGGVMAMTKEQFIMVNGFSNKYYDKGGEDDDLYNRIQQNKLTVSRYIETIGRYTTLYHRKSINHMNRTRLLTQGLKTWRTDGLNSIKYKILNIEYLKLCTYILIDVNTNDPIYRDDYAGINL